MTLANRIFTAAIALLASASLSAAAPASWKIDPNHTEVGFQVRHFFSQVHGRFREFEGSIVFDEADPNAIQVDATVKASSVDTGNNNRDADLRSDHFFDVEKTPTLTFKSTKAKRVGKNKFKITGDLTMRGVTKSVTFDAEFLGSSAVGAGGESWGSKAGFQATTVVNRKDFGINWNEKLDTGGLMVGDMVTIELSIEASLVK